MTKPEVDKLQSGIYQILWDFPGKPQFSPLLQTHGGDSLRQLGVCEIS